MRSAQAALEPLGTRWVAVTGDANITAQVETSFPFHLPLPRRNPKQTAEDKSPSSTPTV